MNDDLNQDAGGTTEIEKTVVVYRHAVVLGWLALIGGIILAISEYSQPSVDGFVCMSIGLVLGAVTVTFGGPLRTIQKLRLRVVKPDDQFKDNNQ